MLWSKLCGRAEQLSPPPGRPARLRWAGRPLTGPQHTEAAHAGRGVGTGLPHSAGGRPEDRASDFVVSPEVGAGARTAVKCHYVRGLPRAVANASFVFLRYITKEDIS